MHPQLITCTCRSGEPCRVPHNVWLVAAAARAPKAAPTVGPAFLARFPDTCRACRGAIAPDSPVRMISSLGPVHDDEQCLP